MRLKYYTSYALLGLALASSADFAAGAESLIDYEKLDLTIDIKEFRAGNHDASGENKYFFVTTLYGLPILKESLKKSFDEREKIEREQGTFGEITIKNLRFWPSEKKPGPGNSISIAGDTIREIVAQTMRDFNVDEEQVAIVCRTQLFEHNKKLMVFGDDTKVGDSSFYIIPETLPHVAVMQNADLTITDKLGTHVTLSINFKHTTPPAKP